jgi:hypothetical protein
MNGLVLSCFWIFVLARGLVFWRVVVGVHPLGGGMEVYTLFIRDAWRAKYYGTYSTRMEWARAVMASVLGGRSDLCVRRVTRVGYP